MQRTLDNGLILRSLGEKFDQDRDNLWRFFGRPDDGTPPESLDVMTRVMFEWADDLTDPERPTITVDDTWVVVDPEHNEQVVASLQLIPQRWRYEDIDLPGGPH